MIVRNWKEYAANENIGELHITENQFMTGNIAGILVEPIKINNIQGSLCDATIYNYPVRYKVLKTELSDESIDDNVLEDVGELIHEMETEGCRFICTTGKLFGLYYKEIVELTELLVIATPLQILEYAENTISENKQICIINDLSLKENLNIIKNIISDDSIMANIVFTNKDFKDYMDSNGAKVTNLSIGAYIWDYIEDYKLTMKCEDIPIYNMKTLMELVKMSVSQTPYGGII
ncbi:aspartate/glutamate racemase family protein [Methanobrevibacter sp.]